MIGISSVTQFASPAALWALLVVPTAVLAFNLASANKVMLKERVLLSAFLSVVLSIGLMALAQPQRVDTYLQKFNPPYGIVALLDDSGSTSLCIEDIRSNRCSNEDQAFEVFRSQLSRFIERRKDDKIGLSVFGDDTKVLTSIEDGSIKSLEALSTLKSRLEGTYMVQAIRNGLLQVQNSSEIGRFLVIMSDGDDIIDRRELNALAEEIKKSHVTVYWIRNEYRRSENPQFNILDHGLETLARAGVKMFSVFSRDQVQAAFDHIDSVESPINFLSTEVPMATSYSTSVAGTSLLFLVLFFLMFRAARRNFLKTERK